MPYERTPAQTNYLRRKYAQQRDEETGCDCSGCDYILSNGKTCIGFLRNCPCDNDPDALRNARR